MDTNIKKVAYHIQKKLESKHNIDEYALITGLLIVNDPTGRIIYSAETFDTLLDVEYNKPEIVQGLYESLVSLYQNIPANYKASDDMHQTASELSHILIDSILKSMDEN